MDTVFGHTFGHIDFGTVALILVRSRFKAGTFFFFSDHFRKIKNEEENRGDRLLVLYPIRPTAFLLVENENSNTLTNKYMRNSADCLHVQRISILYQFLLFLQRNIATLIKTTHFSYSPTCRCYNTEGLKY